MQIREFGKDAVIIKEGDIGESLFKVEDGKVSVRIGYGKDSEQELTVLGPGKIFGEMAVLEAWPRSATVVTVEDGTKVLEISSDEVDRFFTEEPEQIRLKCVRKEGFFTVPPEHRVRRGSVLVALSSLAAGRG